MLIILTNSDDSTVDYVEPSLEKSAYVRINTDEFTSRGQIEYDRCGPTLLLNGTRVHAGDVTSVWYRRPERLRFSEDDATGDSQFALEEWTEALEGFLAHIDEFRWISHPRSINSASSKLEQLTRASKAGFRIPATIVTQDEHKLREFAASFPSGLIAKPMSSGRVVRSDGSEHHIYTSLVSEVDLENLRELRNCPTLFQERIRKTCDIRITAIDSTLHTVAMCAQDEEGKQRCDIRRNNMEDVEYCDMTPPDNVVQFVLEIMGAYRLRFGAFDFAIEEVSGEWVFFEVNPNGQWAWLDIVEAQNAIPALLRAFFHYET